MNLNKYIIGTKISVVKTIEKINENGIGTIFVCDNSGKLCGSVTDGDVRRFLLQKGGDLEADITTIMNPKPVVLFNDDYDRGKNYEELLRKYIISAIPVVDKNYQVVNLIISKEKTQRERGQIDVPLVIMAGGKGTRLKPYTDILPKPLIPIGNLTITEHILERFNSYHCPEYYMIVNYKKEFIKAYFQDKQAEYPIKFIEEEKYMGTGGGLKYLDGIINQTFFLTNCDILVEVNYEKILQYHRKERNMITMVCAQKSIVIPYGTVDINNNGQVIELIEKPGIDCIVSTGLYLIEPEILTRIKENAFVHITDIIQSCLGKEKVGTFVIDDEQWMDMGQLEELEKMKEKMNVF